MAKICALSLPVMLAMLTMVAPRDAWAADAGVSRMPSLAIAAERAMPAAPLQMATMTAPIFVTDVAWVDQETRLQRLRLYRNLGMAIAAGAAFGIGAATGGPAIGVAAGTAMVITFLILP